MLQQEWGSVFVGFTASKKCPHCNNLTPMQIRQGYVKQNLFFVPIGTSHKELDLVCPVCEQKERLITSTLFANQQKKDNLIDLLEGGKEYTKEWLSRLSYKDKEAILKRLNSLKAYNLVKYLGS